MRTTKVPKTMIKLSGHANDITGWRVGKLVAEYPVRRRPGSLNIIWFCSCDCGGSVERVGSRLWQAKWGLQHCGCERALPPSIVAATASEQEKAYFAGYTDAEGCIGIYASTREGLTPYWHSTVSFNQTQPEVVEKLHALYGGGISSRKRDQSRRRQRQLAIQRHSDVRRFLLDIIPYLREKRAQAEIVLYRFDLRAEHKTNQALLKRLVQLKAKRLGAIVIEPRLSISPQAHLKCFDCGERAFSRGFCSRHGQKARREGRIQSNRKGGVPFTYGRALKEFEAPYFAGYFDGDGCIQITSEKRSWYPRIVFAQTQPDTLIELHAIYGGSLTVEEGRTKRHRPKLVYQLAQRAAVLAMLRDMRPFLIEKRSQVELLLELYRPDMSFEDGEKLKVQLSEMKQRTFGETSDLTGTVDP